MSEYYKDPDNELYHYGVTGMRWGIRRAAKKGTTYSYRSHGQKKYERKVNKLKAQEKTQETKAKLAESKEKLELYKIRDKNRVDYVKKTTAGKSFLRTLFAFGSIPGNGTYSRYRAAGMEVGEAFIKSYAWEFVPMGPAQIMSRKKEFDTARKELENRKRR